MHGKHFVPQKRIKIRFRVRIRVRIRVRFRVRIRDRVRVPNQARLEVELPARISAMIRERIWLRMPEGLDGGFVEEIISECVVLRSQLSRHCSDTTIEGTLENKTI